MQAALPGLLGPNKPELPNLAGKVAVITGGALGIGYEVAKALALKGCRVVLTNRKEEQGDAAVTDVKKATDGKADVEWIGCDLGNLKQVRDVFDGIAKKEKRLDFLVLSAGINSNQYGETSDGIDRHFGVNWLGHFYAINRLYPLLRKTAKESPGAAPRIVFESSEMHRFAASDTKFASKEEINDPNHGPVHLYGRTKLAMILGAKYGLAEGVIKKNGDNIYALSVHPGAVATAMQQQWEDAYPGITGKIAKYVSLAGSRSVEQGAYSALWALTSPEIVEKHENGFYFSDPAQPGKETEQASDPQIGENLWKLSEQWVKDVVGPDAIKPWDSSI